VFASIIPPGLVDDFAGPLTEMMNQAGLDDVGLTQL
jgi:hypothetical protein